MLSEAKVTLPLVRRISPTSPCKRLDLPDLQAKWSQ